MYERKTANSLGVDDRWGVGTVLDLTYLFCV